MATVAVTAGQLWRRFSHIDRFVAATRRPDQAQQAKLFEIVRRNRDTAYGREHGFGDLQTLADMIEAGTVTPVVDRCYPLTAAAEAMRHLEGGHAHGKVVITVQA